MIGERGRGRRGIGLLLLVPAVFASCGPAPAEAQKTVVLLLDRSLSTADHGTRDTYCENVHDVVKTLAPGDALVAGWITEASEMQAEFAVSTSFPLFDPGTDNPLLVRKSRMEVDSLLADSLGRIADSLCADLRRNPTPASKTDVMGAIGLAARVFEVEDREQNVLVVMSDMIEDSEEYSFMQSRFDQERIDAILARERQAGRLPNLRGTQVYVAGAGGVSRDHFHDLRRFWIAYFTAAGATLAEENYGTALIGFGG